MDCDLEEPSIPHENTRSAKCAQRNAAQRNATQPDNPFFSLSSTVIASPEVQIKSGTKMRPQRDEMRDMH